MTNEVVLKATGLVKSFGTGAGEVRVLRGVDLEVKRGERVAVTGLSGSGKSTLLHLLAGLDDPDAGQVLVDGSDIAALPEKSLCRLRNEKLGFVYQFHYLMAEFTAVENVAMPLMIGGLKRRIAIDRAADMLGRVGLENRIRHKPAELSGGERQRVAIARALVAEPACVLADEPTGNLDEKTAEEVNELLVELNRDLGMSFIVVTHNLELAARMDRMLVLHNGRLRSD